MQHRLCGMGDLTRLNVDQFNDGGVLGERTAEDIKIAIGSAYRLDDNLEMIIRGRDLISGLPKERKCPVKTAPD